MVKKIVFICVLVVAVCLNKKSQAQSYSFTVDSITAAFQRCDTTQEAFLRVTNTSSSKTDTLIWKRTLLTSSWPTGWTVSTCDNSQCYLASVNQMTFYIAPSASAKIIMNVTPNSVAGTGIIDLKIVNGGYLKDSISGFYKFNIACKTVGINNISANSEINIYPSPFQNNFTISSNNSTRIKFVEMYNVIGALVFKKELATGDDSYSITPINLPKGLYFVSFSDADRKIIATKRIQKD